MSTPLVVPSIAESITEGVLSRWLVADGAGVTIDQPIYELETDKITTEVRAQAAGKVTRGVKEGSTVAIGATVGTLDIGVAGTASEAAKPAAKAASKSDAPKSDAKVEAKAATPAATADDTRPQSPAVRAIVDATGVATAGIAGTGKDGRLTKGDVLAATAAPAPAPTAAPAPAASAPAPAVGGVTRKKMSRLRATIANRLVQAQRTAAILTTFNEIDMAPAMALRKKYKEAFEKQHGVGLGFMSIFARAVCLSLAKYPLINSRIEGDEIVTPDRVHLGVAVGTEKGLMVPVIRDADTLSFAGIEGAIKAFAVKAKAGQIGLGDLEGGTFTISNGGVYGSLMSTPILNPPQSGILGMHTIKERPVAVDGQVVIRPMMYVALSYDHRIVNGAEAVGFLVRLKDLVEAPEKMLLGL